MAVVQELFIYPMKSARGIAQSTARLGLTGFEWDRQWMAVDARGHFVSQRTHPKLAQIVPEISADWLTLSVRDFKPLQLPLEPVGEVAAVMVWEDRCAGLDQGDEAAEWVSAAVGDALRLVRRAPLPDRLANPQFAGPHAAPLAFSDGYPILVCNEASLADLNVRMPEPIPMERFRPNIVLTGLPAFEEDRIDELQIGSIALRLVKPCTRCVITATDQRTGERSTNPLPILGKFRFDRALLGVTFGENAVITSGVGCALTRGAECVTRAGV
jgi:uncharacterized protein